MPSAHKGVGLIPTGNPSSNYTIASIDFSGFGDNTLVAAIANQTIRVFRIFLITGGATNLVFKNGSTALNGAMAMSANGGLTLDLDGEPWFITSAGAAFVLNSSSAVQVGGRLWYQQS